MTRIWRSRSSNAAWFWGGDSARKNPGCPCGRPCVQPSQRGSPGSDLERFEIVSEACVGPVIDLAWPRRTLEQAYGGSVASDGKAESESSQPEAEHEPTASQWLAMAEELLALRIVYLVSQFAHPLRSMSAQLIYGPILLLLAVAWYPFHPLKLMSMVIWAFIVGGVLVTLVVLVQIEPQRLR